MSGIPSSLESMLSEHIEMDKKVYRELCDTLEHSYDALKKLMTLKDHINEFIREEIDDPNRWADVVLMMPDYLQEIISILLMDPTSDPASADFH